MTENVEHHWHEPTQGQVVKAMYQYLADLGISKESIEQVVQQKVTTILAGRVDAWVNSGHFDKLLVQAVAEYAKRDKKSWDENRNYSYVDHLRDLVRQELQRLLVNDYEVKVIARTTALQGK